MKNTVSSFISQQPITVNKSASIETIIKLLKKQKFEHIIVVDDQQVPLGMISKSDIYDKLLHLSVESPGKTYTEIVLSSATAEEIMSKKLSTVNKEDTMDHAAQKLLLGNFHALPVLNDGALIGIISSSDLLKYYLNN